MPVPATPLTNDQKRIAYQLQAARAEVAEAERRGYGEALAYWLRRVAELERLEEVARKRVD